MTASPIQQRMPTHRHDLGGGFTVGRVLPGSPRRALGPFVFIDHIGPVELPADRPMDVRPHPHIGLATVTYLWEGRIEHRDSLGSVQVIEPGAVNWMTAGSGIVHSERSPQDARGKPQRIHGLQLWLALPLEHEEIAPTFSHTAAGELPLFDVADGRVRLIAGRAYGQQSPVPVLSDLFYVDVELPAGGRMPLPTEPQQRGVYVLSGDVRINDDELRIHQLSIIAPGAGGDIVASSDARFVMLGGAPLDAPRYLWWNFVSSSDQRIRKARDDWQAMRLGGVDGDDEFIPLPDHDRPSVVLKPE